MGRRIGTVIAAGLVAASTLVGVPGASAGGRSGGATDEAPVNPFLAPSAWPMAHHNSAQQDATGVPGPRGGRLGDRLELRFVGPAQFGSYVSPPYPGGDRVIWSNGVDRVAKLDADTFEVLAELPLPGKSLFDEAQAHAAIERLETSPPDELPGLAIELAAATLRNITGLYALLDRDGELYLSGDTSIIVYGDEDPDDPASPIVERRTWTLPAGVTGKLVGLNLTYDGRLVAVTDEGWVVAVTRDLAEHQAVQLPFSEGAAALNAERVAAGQTLYGWVRNSYAVDEDGGIYIASNDHLHKVVWTGEELSLDPADGAWSEPYRNGKGLGTGSTPVLMGFGSDDRLVAMTDGDDLMNFTVYWRDEIPTDWEQLPGAPSRRVAGFLPATMGDPDRTAIQSEQAPIVGGYGALVVNNEPATIPEGFPGGRATTLLTGFLGNDERFMPRGMQKFEWDTDDDELRSAWVNRRVSSPNCVPVVSLADDTAFTIGTRRGAWTLEALDWSSGRSRFHSVLGGQGYNSLFSGLILDGDGNLVYGTMFGKARIRR